MRTSDRLRLFSPRMGLHQRPSAGRRRQPLWQWLVPAALALAAGSVTAAEQSPSPFCENLLPVAELRALLGSKAAAVERNVRGPVKETDRQCSRIYALPPFDRFSDELILLVTPRRVSGTSPATPAAAQKQLDAIARHAGKVFGLSQPTGIGDAAVHFRRPDPLSSSRMEFNLSFIRGAHLVELKYQSVDDGKQNKFVYESVELEALAKAIANRL